MGTCGGSLCLPQGTLCTLPAACDAPAVRCASSSNEGQEMENPERILRELVSARDQEVHEQAAARQTAQREIDGRAERRTQRTVAAMGEMADLVRRLNDESAEASQEGSRHIAEARAQLMAVPKGEAVARVADRAS